MKFAVNTHVFPAARVKFAVNTETGENVAIKILDKDKIARQGMGEQIKKEIAVMKMVKQAHVVNLLEVIALYLWPPYLFGLLFCTCQRADQSP